MNWVKLGRVFCASNETEKMVMAGRAPVPLYIGNNTFRVYFGAYDRSMRGRIYSLELILGQLSGKNFEVSNIVKEPIVELGKIGFYDDNGIIPSAIVRHKDELYLYTIGFSLKNKLLFDAATGLAISKDNGRTFDKFEGPVIDRTIYDPCFAASPSVLYDNGKFKMWYVSCDYWEELPDKEYKHFYNIKYKESDDGIHWDVHSKVAINYKNEFEYAISRPSVIKDSDGYKMWYSFRAQPGIETYRIGYAESKDGITWTRKDELMKGFDVSESGWDSEMICYPCVFDHNGKRYMLYNGNGYGKTGFGLAVLEQD